MKTFWITTLAWCETIYLSETFGCPMVTESDQCDNSLSQQPNRISNTMLHVGHRVNCVLISSALTVCYIKYTTKTTSTQQPDNTPHTPASTQHTTTTHHNTQFDNDIIESSVIKYVLPAAWPSTRL